MVRVWSDREYLYDQTHADIRIMDHSWIPRCENVDKIYFLTSVPAEILRERTGASTYYEEK